MSETGNEKILILIKKVGLRIEKLATQLLAPYDLTSTQLKILVILFAHPEKKYRQIDLEKHFALTNPTVTGILNTMEKKGYIERVKNPEDSRSKIIVPTAATCGRRDELIALYETLEASLTQNLSDEAREDLAALLKRLFEESR